MGVVWLDIHRCIPNVKKNGWIYIDPRMGSRMATDHHRCMGVVWLDPATLISRCLLGVVWLDYHYYYMGVVMYWTSIDVWVSYGWTS